MRMILFILAILVFLAGGAIFVGSKSAIHEIEGILLFVISAVFLSGACIIDAILLLHKETKALRLAMRAALDKDAEQDAPSNR